jgi:hypothetical protein
MYYRYIHCSKWFKSEVDTRNWREESKSTATLVDLKALNGLVSNFRLFKRQFLCLFLSCQSTAVTILRQQLNKYVRCTTLKLYIFLSNADIICMKIFPATSDDIQKRGCRQKYDELKTLFTATRRYYDAT